MALQLLFKDNIPDYIAHNLVGRVVGSIMQDALVQLDFERLEGELRGLTPWMKADKFFEYIGDRKNEDEFVGRIKTVLRKYPGLKGILRESMSSTVTVSVLPSPNPAPISVAPTPTPVLPAANAPNVQSPSPHPATAEGQIVPHSAASVPAAPAINTPTVQAPAPNPAATTEPIQSTSFNTRIDLAALHSYDPKEILSLYRDRHKKPIYRITQTGYKSVVHEGITYVIVTFLCSRGDDLKCCTSLNVQGKFCNSNGVTVKGIWPPPPPPNSQNRYLAKFSSTQNTQFTFGVDGDKPQATVSANRGSSVEFELEAGQTLQTGFRSSTFVLNLGLENIISSAQPQGIVDPVEIDVAVRLKEVDTTSKLEFIATLNYKSDAMVRTFFHHPQVTTIHVVDLSA